MPCPIGVYMSDTTIHLAIYGPSSNVYDGLRTKVIYLRIKNGNSTNSTNICWVYTY